MEQVIAARRRRTFREKAPIIFISKHVVVEEGDAYFRKPKSWDLHDRLRIQMGDEFVPVHPHFLDVVLKLLSGKFQPLQQLLLELLRLRDYLSPMVLSLAVGKEFAPLEDAVIEEVTV